MQFPIISVSLSRCVTLFLVVTWGPIAMANASENEEKTEFLYTAGEKIIREICRSDNMYSQCVGQTEIECEKSMRLSLDECVTQLIDLVPDLDVDPKSFGNDNQTPYHILGEKMGLCLTDRHVSSLGLEKEAINDCWDTQ